MLAIQIAIEFQPSLNHIAQCRKEMFAINAIPIVFIAITRPCAGKNLFSFFRVQKLRNAVHAGFDFVFVDWFVVERGDNFVSGTGRNEKERKTYWNELHVEMMRLES